MNLEESLENACNLPQDQEIDKQKEPQYDGEGRPIDSLLDLRDFFDAYDKGDPYMISAVQELYGEILDKAPEILSKESQWFKTWMWGGKRDLVTGLKYRDGRFIYPRV